MHRSKNWHKAERMAKKEEKKRSWHKKGGFDSVMFLPATPGGKMKKMFEHTIRGSGMRIKGVERRGKTLKSMLQTSNPFKTNNCGRDDCFICTTTGKGNCNVEGITYLIKCLGEGCIKYEYKGETATNGYTRGVEHMTNLTSRNIENSPLWRHCVEQHRGEPQRFQMSVTRSFRNDAMLRQIAEAVQIMVTPGEWNT